jgi:hypothetical protein
LRFTAGYRASGRFGHVPDSRLLHLLVHTRFFQRFFSSTGGGKWYGM